MQTYRSGKTATPLMLLSAALTYGLLNDAHASVSEPVAATPPPCSAPAVVTTAGRFCGVTQQVNTGGGSTQAVRAYMGMRYGFARRFAQPQPVTASGEAPATLLGNVCPQDPANLPANAPVSEDCLFLNVWTPVQASTSPLPVLVFIHGGGFQEGASSQAVFMGTRLAAIGQAVIVTINYRLGALGFLTGGTGPNQITPNLGLADQRLAIQWVHDNASAFGGDPSRITLFGESAGAMSIGIHLTAPAVQGLFNSAIMESNPYGLPYKTADQANAVRTLFNNSDAVTGGCTSPAAPPGSLACLKSLTWQQIVAAQGQITFASQLPAMQGQFSALLTWNPQVDGNLVPVQPNEAVIKKPVIAGTNLNEGALFITLPLPLQPGGPGKPGGYWFYLTRLFGEDTAADIIKLPRYAPNPTDNRPELARIVTDYLFTCATRHVMSSATNRNFAYLFSHRPSFAVWPGSAIPLPCQPVADGGQGQVCHSFEMPYVFRNPIAVDAAATPNGKVPPGTNFTAAERPLINSITQYWTSFAANGRPSDSSPTTPAWPQFTKNGTRQVLNLTPGQTQDNGANCGFWDTVGYDKGANLYDPASDAN
ncbi:MAG: carboxylesterase family protein [Methylotetracoccus sp.]